MPLLRLFRVRLPITPHPILLRALQPRRPGSCKAKQTMSSRTRPTAGNLRRNKADGCQRGACRGPTVSPKAVQSPNPFAETDNPVFVPGNQPPPTAEPATNIASLPATPATTSPPADSPIPAPALPAAPSSPPAGVQPPPASPQPEWSAQSDSVSPPEATRKTPSPAPPKTTPVAAATHTNEGYDAFGDPVPAKAPTAPAPVEVADDKPSCAAPVAKAIAPAAKRLLRLRPHRPSHWR